MALRITDTILAIIRTGTRPMDITERVSMRPVGTGIAATGFITRARTGIIGIITAGIKSGAERLLDEGALLAFVHR